MKQHLRIKPRWSAPWGRRGAPWVYLHTVKATARMPIHVEDPPLAPDLAGLQGAGISVTCCADFGQAAASAADRRRILATRVANDGWSW